MLQSERTNSWIERIMNKKKKTKTENKKLPVNCANSEVSDHAQAQATNNNT